MWGQIILDNYFVKNFHTYFLHTKEYLLMNLIIWQYWWWFWFFLLMVFYYILIFKYVSTKKVSFNPKIMTSKKAHGRWGDFISGALPVFWCFNILVNSNFLLKLNEWQTESSLFTLRIRGKQWYWVYKINPNWKSKINKFSYHIGYTGFLDIKAKNHTQSPFKSISNKKYFDSFNKKMREQYFKEHNANHAAFETNTFNSYSHNWPIRQVETYNYFNPYQKLSIYKDIFHTKGATKGSPETVNFYMNSILNILGVADSFDTDSPFLKYSKFIEYQGNEFNYFINEDKSMLTKPSENDAKQEYSRFWITLKQKSIKKFSEKVPFNNFELQTHSKYHNFLPNQNKLNWKNNNRLLKVDNILYLPTDYRITVITNSFDVVHSWFIPGLGIKMDCVPGRSTHHSMKFHQIGFYYGQCAEICGRFHHHMPINVVLLNMDLFLFWWNKRNVWEI